MVIYAYRKGNGFVPSLTQVYGQAKKNVVVQPNSYTKFVVKRSEKRALDKPTQRCDNSDSERSISKCAGKILEEIFPCSPRFLMNNHKQETCTNLSEMNETKLQHIVHLMNSLEEYEIFQLTGCMPSCSRSKFELDIDTESLIPDVPVDIELAILSFVFEKGEYRLIEEHYLYGIWNFIPDVGGYLGLLLGYSLLSLYHMLIQWLMDAKKWLLQ